MRRLRKIIYYLKKSHNPVLKSLLHLILALYRLVDLLFLKKATKLDRTAENIVSKDRKFCCVVVPKCASRTLLYNIRDAAKDKGFSYTIGRAKIARLINRHAGYFHFTFVRSPWARAYSCYKQKILRHDPISDALYFTGRSGLHGKMSFRDFVVWLGSSEGRDDCANRHWASQHLVLGMDLGMKYDFIGRLETMDRDLEMVTNHLGIGMDYFTRIRNRSSRQDEYLEHYDEELIAIIARRYARDIEIFGYQAPQLPAANPPTQAEP